MPSRRQWDVRKFECREQKRTAGLVIEWEKSAGRAKIKSICCDNPRFYDLNNWDCKWSCWERIEKSGSKGRSGK